MLKQYCPQCGKSLTENARYCINCGNPIPQLDDITPDDVTTDTQAEDSKRNVSSTKSTITSNHQNSKPNTSNKNKKNKKNWHIGYWIFLIIILSILIFLINKKLNAVAPKPMHSLPNERPIISNNYILTDSLDSTTIEPTKELELLTPTLPHLNIQSDKTASPLEIEDDYEEYSSEDESAQTPPSVSNTSQRASTSIQLTTEQSVRNLLISNRFVDPVSSDVLTFRNNGNILLKNGDTIATDMEVFKLSNTSATLDYYDDNKSWDIKLDISGQQKKLNWMENTYISE